MFFCTLPFEKKENYLNYVLIMSCKMKLLVFDAWTNQEQWEKRKTKCGIIRIRHRPPLHNPKIHQKITNGSLSGCVVNRTCTNRTKPHTKKPNNLYSSFLFAWSISFVLAAFGIYFFGLTLVSTLLYCKAIGFLWSIQTYSIFLVSKTGGSVPSFGWFYNWKVSSTSDSVIMWIWL